MKVSKRLMSAISLLLMILMVLTMGLTCNQQSSDSEGEDQAGGTDGEPIVLGAIFSETGKFAALGIPEKKTLQMEVAAFNEAGGVDGRLIEVIYEDDASTPEKAKTAFEKLVNQHNVLAVIGPSFTTPLPRCGSPRRTATP